MNSAEKAHLVRALEKLMCSSSRHPETGLGEEIDQLLSKHPPLGGCNCCAHADITLSVDDFVVDVGGPDDLSY